MINLPTETQSSQEPTVEYIQPVDLDETNPTSLITNDEASQELMKQLEEKMYSEWLRSLPKGLRTLVLLSLSNEQLQEILHSANERASDESLEEYHQRLQLRAWITKYRWKLHAYTEAYKTTREIITAN